jgi:hypothetical protein
VGFKFLGEREEEGEIEGGSGRERERVKGGENISTPHSHSQDTEYTRHNPLR